MTRLSSECSADPLGSSRASQKVGDSLSVIQPPTGVPRTLAALCALIGILFGLMAWTESVAAQERVVQEEELVRCIGPGAYVDVEDAKEKLLAAVKRAAITSFYGVIISAQTTAADSVLTRNEVNVAAQGLVRMKADPDYYNSTEHLGEICVRAHVYVTAEDRQLFDWQPVGAERVCDSGEGTPEERQQEVQDRLRNDALLAYDGRLAAVDAQRRMALLREVQFVRAGFRLDAGIYCASLTGRVMPFEVYALLGVAPPHTPAATPTHTPAATPTHTPAVTPTHTPAVTPLRVLGATPTGALAVGALLTVRGSAPPETQIEVLAGGAPLGTTTSAADGAWQVEIPFNTAGTYRLTTRMYLADGTVQPGSRDVLIQVVVPTPTRMPVATPVASVAEVLSDRLNVRAGPGTEYAVLQTLSRGERLSVTGQIDNCAWLQVRRDAGQAWVSGNPQYIRLSVACQNVALKPAPPLPAAPAGIDPAATQTPTPIPR